MSEYIFFRQYYKMKVKHIKKGGDVEAFNEEFPNHKMVIAGFFAAWCGHCKTFKPEWEKFTNEAKDSPLEGLVVTIPEEHMKDAKCDQSNFKGFPTVRIFNTGHFKDYEGKREAKALMDHIKTLVSGQRGGRKKKRRRRRKSRRKTKRHRRRRHRKRSRRRTKRRR
jgi:thiol-disulfide isomerase/thioredoxin